MHPARVPFRLRHGMLDLEHVGSRAIGYRGASGSTHAAQHRASCADRCQACRGARFW